MKRVITIKGRYAVIVDGTSARLSSVDFAALAPALRERGIKRFVFIDDVTYTGARSARVRPPTTKGRIIA